MSNWPSALADVLVSGYNIREPGLIGWWPFNDGSASIAYDRSGNGKNGTVNGAVSVDGLSGKAFSLNGTTQYVDLSTSAASLILLPSWTMRFVSYGNSIFALFTEGVATQLFYVSLGSGTLTILLKSSSTLIQATKSGLSTTSWLDVMICGSTSGIVVYINGTQQSLTFSTGNSSTSAALTQLSGCNKLQIGRINIGAASYYAGNVDEPLLRNYASSANDAYQLYKNVTRYEALPNPDIGGYNESAQDGVIRSSMDAGPAKVRSRFTASTRYFQQSMVLDRYQKQVLEQFYASLGGANTFTWTHPDTGESMTARFLSRPQFVLDGGLYYRASFGLEVLP